MDECCLGYPVQLKNEKWWSLKKGIPTMQNLSATWNLIIRDEKKRNGDYHAMECPGLFDLWLTFASSLEL